MKYLILLLMLSGVSLFAEPCTASKTSECRSNPDKNKRFCYNDTCMSQMEELRAGDYHFGQSLGNYRGVEVYSNFKRSCTSPDCHNSGGTKTHIVNGYYYGRTWQCAEYAARFYKDAFNIEKNSSHALNYGNAINWFSGSSDKFDSFLNGSSSKPRVDDLLIWDTGDSIGHIAVIREVNDRYLVVAQQNVYFTERDANFTLPLIYNNTGTLSYKVNHPQIKGWIRLKENQCQKVIDHLNGEGGSFGDDAHLGCKACENDAKTVNKDGSPQVSEGECRTQTELRGRKLMKDSEGCYRNVLSSECGSGTMGNLEGGCSISTSNNSNFSIFIFLFFIAMILLRKKSKS